MSDPKTTGLVRARLLAAACLLWLAARIMPGAYRINIEAKS